MAWNEIQQPTTSSMSPVTGTVGPVTERPRIAGRASGRYLRMVVRKRRCYAQSPHLHRDIAPYEIAGANPIRHICFRMDEELRELMLELRGRELRDESTLPDLGRWLL
jgi:hypothetical protein